MVIACALAAGACGRISFDPRTGDGALDPDARPACSWIGGPRLINERVRTDLSSVLKDSDPILVQGDPLTITLTSDVTARGTEVFMAHRAAVDAPFDTPALLTELSTTGDELAMQLDSAGHGYFVTSVGSDYDLYELQRTGATLQVVRALSELNNNMRQYDPFMTADGLTLWFAASTTTSDQDIFIAHRPDRGAVWGNVEPFAYNTLFGDAGATVTDDELVVVYASQAAANSDGTIHYATRPTRSAPWSAPQLIPLASHANELEPSIRGDGCELFFARSTAVGDPFWDIYSVDIE